MQRTRPSEDRSPCKRPAARFAHRHRQNHPLAAQHRQRGTACEPTPADQPLSSASRRPLTARFHHGFPAPSRCGRSDPAQHRFAGPTPTPAVRSLKLTPLGPALPRRRKRTRADFFVLFVDCVRTGLRCVIPEVDLGTWVPLVQLLKYQAVSQVTDSDRPAGTAAVALVPRRAPGPPGLLSGTHPP